jgi:beta-glucosidase
MKLPDVLIVSFALAVSALRAQDARPLWRDPAQPVEARVATLLKELTLEEKDSMVHGTGNWTSGGVPRLGLPPITMDDGPLGVRAETQANSFTPANRDDDAATGMPATLGLAATWNPQLAFDYGTVIGAEAFRRGKNIMLGPSLNIQRTPLNGRNFEYLGEDPFLTARIAVGYIKGQAAEGITGTAKHFAANNQETNRNTVDARVDERTLREIYFPAFKAAVQEGGVLSVMGSYNFLNGQHACENDWLLNQVLKTEWGFKGLVESDWSGTHDTKEAVFNGLDIEMPGNGPGGVNNFLGNAYLAGLRDGTYPMATLDGKVSRILYVMFQIGMLDTPAKRVPVPLDAAHPLSTKAHLEIARHVAEESIVLLKNSAGLLPLDAAKIKTIAVIGNNAETKFSQGGGSAQIKSPYEITALEGIRSRAGAGVTVNFAQGYSAAAGLAGGGRRGGVATGAVTTVAPGLPTFENLKAALMLTEEQAAQIKPLVDAMNTAQAGVTAAQAAIAGPRGQLAGVLSATQRSLLAQFLNPTDVPTAAQLAEEAVAVAKAADLVIYVGGLTHETGDAESGDRADLKLPFNQDALLAQVLAANPRTVVVLNGGGALEMPWVDLAGTLLYAWYGGIEGGNALARVLFGDVSPSGKLPNTFPKLLADTPTAHGGAEAYPGIANPAAPAGGRGGGGFRGGGGNALVPTTIETYSEKLLVGYRWYDAKKIEPLFPFGFGLSYTKFEYSNLRLVPAASGSAPRDAVVSVQFDITNTGTREGSEVAQVYVHQEKPALERPKKELKGFDKVSLKPGEKKTVTVPLNKTSFAYFDPAADKMAWVAEAGDFQIIVGASSRDPRLNATYRLAQTSVFKD